MKSLFSILGLSFLSLTLTNCSLSPEQIASRIEPSKELREAELRAKEERAVELQRQLEEEKRQREEAERRERELEAERQRQKKNEVSLVSAKEVDYRKLRDLLKAKKWKEADEETRRVMLKVASRESEGGLRTNDAEKFSCTDLGTIDKLWVKYSNGKYGISVQKQIFRELGGSRSISKLIYLGGGGPKDWQLARENWEKFGDKVGWRKEGKWNLEGLSSEFREGKPLSKEEDYAGHLPVDFMRVLAPSYGWIWYLRVSECDL